MPLPEAAASRRPGAAVFWLATALLVSAAAAILAPVLGAFQDQAAAIAALEARRDAQARILDRADGMAAEMRALEARAPEARSPESRDGDGGDLLSGATDALAGAELQALVAAAVANAGGRLVSTQALPAETAGPGFKRIVVRTTATLTSRRLRDVLHGLEAGRPRLLIRDLTLRATDAKGVDLELTMDVAGFRTEATP